MAVLWISLLRTLLFDHNSLSVSILDYRIYIYIILVWAYYLDPQLKICTETQTHVRPFFAKRHASFKFIWDNLFAQQRSVSRSHEKNICIDTWFFMVSLIDEREKKRKAFTRSVKYSYNFSTSLGKFLESYRFIGFIGTFDRATMTGVIYSEQVIWTAPYLIRPRNPTRFCFVFSADFPW